MLSPYFTFKVDGKVASTFPMLVDVTSMSVQNDVVDMPFTHLKHRSIDSETMLSHRSLSPIDSTSSRSTRYYLSLGIGIVQDAIGFTTLSKPWTL
jgi:hypothetical protein